jgi:hypothetical protein
VGHFSAKPRGSNRPIGARAPGIVSTLKACRNHWTDIKVSQRFVKWSTKRERGYKPLTFKADLGEDFWALKVVKAEAEEARRARATANFILFRSVGM